MNAQELTARIERLETATAHLEKLCDDLNQVLLQQGKALAALQRKTQELSLSIESTELERIRATNSKPPHYLP